MPAAQDIAILKDRFLKNSSKIQFQLQGWYVPNKESCLSYTGHAYWSLSMPLPNITKYFKPFRSYEVHKNLA